VVFVDDQPLIGNAHVYGMGGIDLVNNGLAMVHGLFHVFRVKIEQANVKDLLDGGIVLIAGNAVYNKSGAIETGFVHEVGGKGPFDFDNVFVAVYVFHDQVGYGVLERFAFFGALAIEQGIDLDRFVPLNRQYSRDEVFDNVVVSFVF
jgi:hypothetical protein